MALSLNGEKHRVELSPPLQISFTHPKHVGYTHFKSLRFFYVSNVLRIQLNFEISFIDCSFAKPLQIELLCEHLFILIVPISFTVVSNCTYLCGFDTCHVYCRMRHNLKLCVGIGMPVKCTYPLLTSCLSLKVLLKSWKPNYFIFFDVTLNI